MVKMKKHLKKTVTLVKMKVRKMKKIKLNPQKRRVKSTIETYYDSKVITTAYFSYSSLYHFSRWEPFLAKAFQCTK